MSNPQDHWNFNIFSLTLKEYFKNFNDHLIALTNLFFSFYMGKMLLMHTPAGSNHSNGGAYQLKTPRAFP